MKNKQIMDLEAMTSFKDNLYKKKVGGLRTSLATSGTDYNVEWNASQVDLGRTLETAPTGIDAFCTLRVHDIYADALNFRVGQGTYSSAKELADRLDALGFRKAPSFGHGAVSQYVGDLSDAAGGLGASLYPNYEVGWRQFEYVSDATAFLVEPKNDFSLMRIGKIAIVQGSAWYRFKDYSGYKPSPELLLKVSIPEGFRMVSGGMHCLGFSALITNQGAYGHSPAAFPGRDCFIYDYGIDGLGKLMGVFIGEVKTESPLVGQADSSNTHVVSFWLRCPTGPDTDNGYSIRLSLNGWWQCEEGMPEPTE